MQMHQPGDPPASRDWLLQTEERFRLLFDDAPVAYHEIDREGRITRVNRAECAMLGYERSELIGKPVWDLVPPGERDQSRADGGDDSMPTLLDDSCVHSIDPHEQK